MIVSKVYSNLAAYGSTSGAEWNKIEKQLDECFGLADYDTLHTWTRQIIHKLFVLEQENSHGGTTNIKKILRYLEDNYTAALNLKTIAEVFHMNALYLGRILKQETGCSFTEYINQLRLEKAKELLLSTELSAKQISEAVGYNNDKYFNTLFRKYMNMPPREYRIRAKAADYKEEECNENKS